MPLRTANFWFSGRQRRNVDGSIYIRYEAPPYSAGTVIVKSHDLFFVIWHSFVGIRTVEK